ncbi:unnamed protein product, partial [Ectocarpus sp. 8 AP-2014]
MAVQSMINPGLVQTLHFGGRMGGEEGMEALAKVLSKCEKLMDFQLSNTEVDATSVINSLASSASVSNGLLECLAFYGNSVNGDELAKVTKTKEDGTEHVQNALVALASSSPKMMSLNLGGCGFD